MLVAIAQEGFAELAKRFDREREVRGKKKGGERAVLLALGRVYLRYGLERPAEFRLQFGESGLPSRDPRLRLTRVKKGAYQHLAEASAEYIAAHGLREEPESLANALWAAAHGVVRLVIDGAIPLDEQHAGALIERVVDAILEGTPRRAATTARPRKPPRPA